MMEEVLIQYNKEDNSGIFVTQKDGLSVVWDRIVSSCLNYDPNSLIRPNKIKLPWFQLLSILREYSPLQRQLNFKFVSDDSSKVILQKFIAETKATNLARNKEVVPVSSDEINTRLSSIGFTKRRLRPFQLRDISKLASIPNGANFSVPGAGKTTVTFAIHLLTRAETDKLLVICPKSAFTAWEEIFDECIDIDKGWPYKSSSFLNLSHIDDRHLIEAFNSEENKFFYTNYENFVARKELFSYMISSTPTHVVLDESHRMKAGQSSQRGSVLLSISNLPTRKDILSGTPMPQSPSDLQAQLDFLWPGSSLGLKIQRGDNPSDVISGLFSRTTKEELGLPPVNRRFVQVPMTKPQASLYGIVKSEMLRQLSSFRGGRGIDILKARKSVIRLLQIGSNPILAVRGISEDIYMRDSAVINALLENPISPKIEEACRLVRENKKAGRKTVLWTIFTQNILDLQNQLSDLNPSVIYGEIPSGDFDDLTTREGMLKRFHIDSNCWVLIANPAAAGEGISLHTVCHEAIYLDRSYVSTHYLQSIDRIHRLGLAENEVTNITILQIATPKGLGSIDFSVSRRLATKIRALEQLLNDNDLHQIAYDEENSIDPVDLMLDVEDVADLISELEGNIEFDSTTGV